MINNHLKILKKYKMPPGLIKHSLGVYKVTLFLVDKLKTKGVKIDETSLLKAALLHDIDKVHLGSENISHGVKAVEMLKKEGVGGKTASLIRNHPAEKILGNNFFDLSLEYKILYYADKRFGQKSCSLEERITDWRVRYPHDGRFYDVLLSKMKELEEDLSSKLDLDLTEIVF